MHCHSFAHRFYYNVEKYKVDNGIFEKIFLEQKAMKTKKYCNYFRLPH